MRTFVLYRPERLARVQKALAEAEIEAELVLGPEPLSPVGSLSAAEASCYEGHRDILRRAVGEMALVLEDDFLPAPEWRDLLANVIFGANRPWDFINLGRYMTIGGEPVWSGVEDSYAFTTHAYLLSANGAGNLLAALPDPPEIPFDWAILRLKAFGLLGVYTANPRLFRQDRAGCPGLIHREREPSETWPLDKKMPWETKGPF